MYGIHNEGKNLSTAVRDCETTLQRAALQNHTGSAV